MSKTKGFIYGSISAATYGLIPLFALPIMAKGIFFDSILCYRFLIASLSIAILMLIRKESFRIKRKELFTLITLGVLFSSSAMFLFWSYKLMAAGIASTILFVYPVFVAILMSTLFHEKISWLTRLAIIVAISGVAMLYMGDSNGKITLVGILIVLLSALTYALYLIVVNKSNIKEMSGIKLTFYSMSVATCLFFIKAQLNQGLQPLPDTTSMINIFLLGIVPTVISCITMVSSVHHIGSTYTAVLGAMEPLTAVCVGIWVFSEPFTPNLAIGIILIIASVTMIILSSAIRKSLGHLSRVFVQLRPKR